MIIIGITGTLGAGKGTIVDYLIREKDFIHYSVRSYLLEKVRAAGMPLDRDSMVEVANSLRKEYGSSYITDQLYEKAVVSGKNCVIESIRSVGEIKSLRKNPGFVLIAVDADPEIRYLRIKERNSETDHISYSKFLKNEQREMQNTDEHKQNISECIKRADHLIKNNGSREDLYRKVEKLMNKIM
ncbi:MAG: AAA family ATPase [Bacteroidales bacterium]